MTGGALPFRVLGRIVDGALDLDPEARAALSELSGKVVDFDIAGAGSIRLRIDGEHVRVEPRDDSAGADVTIRGAPLSLLRFMFDDDREAMILGGEVRLQGDIALATRLQRIAARMDPDFEEALARHLGDVPAHELVRGMRGLGDWLRGAAEALMADASEYLLHETRATPRREEVDRFVHDVDDLRDGAERLEARIARLERRRAPRP